MTTETRSFDDLVMVSAVGRYTPAERSGLIAGDIILMFGAHKPSALKEDPELLERIGARDWLTVLRGDIYFKMQPRDGLAGATFEPATALEDVVIPSETANWQMYTAGVQSDGTLLLIPQKISGLWAFFPVILYTRYRLWQMFTGSMLVYGIAAMMGFVPFLLTYCVSALPIYTSGAYLLKSAAEKQGYAKRGEMLVAGSRDMAALEIETTRRNRAARQAPAKPKPQVEAVVETI